MAVTVALAEAGQHARAETLAGSMTGGESQVEALAVLAAALAQTGQKAQAVRVAAKAERLAIPQHHSWSRAELFAVKALAAAGEHARAEALARTVTHPSWQAEALASVAGALAHTGQHARAIRVANDAETMVRSITDPYRAEAVEALASVARALAYIGQQTQATRVADEAEALARSITNPDRWQAEAFMAGAGALAQAGCLKQTRHVIAQVCSAAEWVTVMKPILALESSALVVVADLRPVQTLAVGAEVEVGGLKPSAQPSAGSCPPSSPVNVWQGGDGDCS